MPFRMDLQIQSYQQLDGWSGSYQNAGLNLVFLLRRKDNPYAVLFLMYSPYSRNGADYQESLGIDQWGQGMYHGAINDVGGPCNIGENRSLQLDVIQLLEKANRKAEGKLGGANRYDLAGVTIGWEAVGYHEFQHELSNISLDGILK